MPYFFPKKSIATVGGSALGLFGLLDGDMERGDVFLPTSGAIRVLADNSVGLDFLQSVSYIKSIPTHEKIFAVYGKKWPKCHF